MKAPALLVVAACALTGCNGDSSSASNDSVAAADRLDVSQKALGRPIATPGSGMPVRESGVVGGVTGTDTFMVQSSAGSADDAASPTSSDADALQDVNAATAPAPTMVIRTGQAFIEVDKVDPALLKIRQLTAQVGGYITNSSISAGRDQIRQATLELKIPVTKYDQAVGSLSTIGKVETVNSTAQDVGEEFVDVTARVKNAGGGSRSG